MPQSFWTPNRASRRQISRDEIRLSLPTSGAHHAAQHLVERFLQSGFIFFEADGAALRLALLGVELSDRPLQSGDPLLQYPLLVLQLLVPFQAGRLRFLMLAEHLRHSENAGHSENVFVEQLLAQSWQALGLYVVKMIRVRAP